MPYTQLFYHLVWSTKNREPMLRDEEAARFVHQQLRRKSEALGASVFAVNGWMDHVHVIVAVPPKLAISEFVGQIKGASSTLINKAAILEERFQWQREYAAFSMDRKRLPNHIAYVDAQKEHHIQGTTFRILEPRGDEPREIRETPLPYVVEDPGWRREMEFLDQEEQAPEEGRLRL